MSIEFISLRDVRLTSKSGHVALMKANVARTLPEALHMEARTNGCVPVKEVAQMTEVKTEEAKTEEVKTDEPAPTQDRDGDIKSAIELLIASNNEDNFNAHGIPKVKSVEDIISYDVSAAEVKEVFTSMKAEG